MRQFLVIALALSIGGCSNAVKHLCEADIKDHLLNPETAEFFDFRKIKEHEFRTGWENKAWRLHGVTPGNRYRYGDQMKSTIDETMTELRETNANFYSVRVKADSRIGMKVTSNYVCAGSKETSEVKESCGCVDADAQ